MSNSVQVLQCKIERIVHPHSWRKTRYATFQGLDGYLLCEVFFESAEYPLPRMQIRSEVRGLEHAAMVAVAIQMASNWAVEELARMKAIERDK